MGQHSARRGEPSWFGRQDVETGDLNPGLPVVSPVWDGLEQTQPDYSAPARIGGETLRRGDGTAQTPCGAQRRSPRPRPRPSWSAQDFAAWSVFCHPDLGNGVCGCQTPGCTVRAHLDLIDWGPAGPPLPTATN